MRAAFFTALVLLTACLQERGPATAIDVSVKSDLDADELGEIQYSVFPREGDPAAAPVASQVARGPALKQSFVVEQGRQRALRVVIEGRGAKGKVRYEAFARFVPEQTVALQVFLGRACLAKSCPSNQTCVARAQDGGEPGTCVAVPLRDRLAPVLKPGDESAWDPPGAATGSMSTPTSDGGVCKPRPGDACDPVHDCGCVVGQHCQVRGGAPVCTPGGSLPADAKCRADGECKGALACGPARTCAEQCVADDDCGGGTCVRLPGQTFGTCLKLCSDRGSCPLSVPCSPFLWGAAPSRSVCLDPIKVCPYRNDGRCDEPLIGSGLCARGADPEDCACDPVRQTGCPSTQTCNLVTDEQNGAALKQCEPYGPSPMGGRCQQSECGRGLTCVSGLCHKYCREDADCAAGVPCIGLTAGDFDVMIGVCLLECTPNGTPSCVGDARCKPEPDAVHGGICTVEP